jgi:hypothetical protein
VLVRFNHVASVITIRITGCETIWVADARRDDESAQKR